MNVHLSDINEAKAEKAFSKQSIVFDAVYRPNTIVQYKRERVRKHVLQYAGKGGHILELNAGTGEDAVYFAGMGFQIHATDISAGMQTVLKQKAAETGFSEKITTEICSFTALNNLAKHGPYDHIFSNFAGLNCTDRLHDVLDSLAPLLHKGGIVTMVILPKFCLWETALLLKGKWRTAFRRFSGSKGASSHIEGEYFRCWYYNPSYIKKIMKKDFDIISVEGLCSWVPPSYIEGFAEKYPAVYRFLCRMENRYKSVWPFTVTGDYYIISLRKK